MKSYQELIIWQKSRQLTVWVYNITRTFPSNEQFGLISQINRSAVSIPSNIAEGWSRNSTKDFINFLYIARGSLAELETQLLISYDLTYIKAEALAQITPHITELSKMVSGTITSLKNKITPKL